MHFFATIGLLLFLALIFQFRTHWDEPWFFELSWWQAQTGFAKTQMWQIAPNQNSTQFVTHKLYIASLALLHKLGWANVTSIKIWSLLFSLFNLAMIFSWCKRNLSLNAAYFSSLLYLGFYWTQFLSFTSRPEMMLLSFGLSSYFLLEKYFKNKKPKHLILSSILAGLSVIVHLNGFVFIGGSVISLFLLRPNKRYDFFLFGSISGLISLLYFWDIRSLNDFQTLLYQFSNDPALAKTSKDWYAPLLRILNEHKRFFNHGYESAISLLVFYSLFQLRNTYFKKYRFLAVYSLTNIILLAAISRAPIPNYIVMHYLFLILVPTIMFQSLLSNEPSKTLNKRIFIGLFSLFLLVNISNTLKDISAPKRNIKMEEKLISQTDKDTSIMITSNFVYQTIGRNTLSGERYVKFSKKLQKLNLPKFEKWYASLINRNVQAILLDKEYMAESLLFLYSKESEEKLISKDWILLHRDDRYLSFKRKYF